MERRNSRHQPRPDKFFPFFRILHVILGSQMFSRRVHMSPSHFAHVIYRGLHFNQGLIEHISKMLLKYFFSTRLVTQALYKSLPINTDTGNHRNKEQPLYRNRFAPRLHSSPILIVLLCKITPFTDRFYKKELSAF